MKGQISINIEGHTTTASTSLLILGQPISVELDEDEYWFYKFIVSNNETIEFDMNTLFGYADYSIMSEQSDSSGDIDFNNLIFEGTSDSSYFNFEPSNPKFSVGKTYYVVIQGAEKSRVVISISHIGDYKQISDATPQTITLSKEGSVFYYLVDPYVEEAKIIIEAIPEL